MIQNITPPKISPLKFKKLIDLQIILKNDKDLLYELEDLGSKCFSNHVDLGKNVDILARANNSMLSDFRMTVKKKNDQFKSLEEQANDLSDHMDVIRGTNFLRIAYETVENISHCYYNLHLIIENLIPSELFVTNSAFGKNVDEKDFNSYDNIDDLQKLFMEMSLNEGVINRFISGLNQVRDCKFNIYKSTQHILAYLEAYHKELDKRHTVDGVQIHGDALITDIAITIFKNIDSHGEIAEGKNVDEISPFSLKKAELIAGSLDSPIIFNWISNADGFLNYLIDNLNILWECAAKLEKNFEKYTRSVDEILNTKYNNEHISDNKYAESIIFIKDLSPQSIVFKDKSVMLSGEERFNLNFQNETLSKIVELLQKRTKSDELVQYILERKSYLRKFFEEENSFFVCKIGARNPFGADAPGTLTVIPGERPNATMDDITGDGVEDVKEFLQQVKDSDEFSDLFIATSPSKSADKNNVLLIGPMGSGKSELMRSVASEKDSIGIYAQGSDFNTCWMGEAEKNPKRLFEAALKLQKSSKKHVHMLIDEIDTVLNNDNEHGKFNYTLEFQMLMDGMVAYPGLSVWGTTNSPKRIPMPMIRRFSCIKIIGELNKEHRVKLLKQFMDYMPNEHFTDEIWEHASDRLEGATGDIIRKVIDHVWRNSLSQFKRKNPEKVKELVKILNADGKFEIKKFTKEKREDFKRILAKDYTVTPDYLKESIDIHLNNIAVRKEIETAVNTYKNAKEYLFQLDSGSR